MQHEHGEPARVRPRGKRRELGASPAKPSFSEKRREVISLNCAFVSYAEELVSLANVDEFEHWAAAASMTCSKPAPAL